jgi:RNA-directed DNA polymerase
VSKDVFSAVDHHAWHRLMRWTRAKYAGKTRLGMTQLRHRFCDEGWRFVHNGVVFTGASSVTVTLRLPKITSVLVRRRGGTR